MTQPLAGKQILIVEDEAVFRSLLDSWLSSLGAETLLADDGIVALEHLKSTSPDLMICDIAMPRMNGLKLVEHLRNSGNQMPVLVISATDNMADIARAHNATAAQILLAWVISHQGVMAIPKAASVAHVEENAAALKIVLSAEELARLDDAFPAPGRKTPLDMV